MGLTNKEHRRREDHDNEILGLLNDSRELIQRSSVTKSQE